MTEKATNLWKYIAVAMVSFLLIAIFAITYSSTISNGMYRLQDDAVPPRIASGEL